MNNKKELLASGKKYMDQKIKMNRAFFTDHWQLTTDPRPLATYVN